jgi:hypothetical protein
MSTFLVISRWYPYDTWVILWRVSIAVLRAEGGKMKVEHWTYEVDPMEQMTREAFDSFMSVFFGGHLVKSLEVGAQKLAAGLDPKLGSVNSVAQLLCT